MIATTKFRKALATSSTATAFVQKEPTTTLPSGDGIWDLRGAELSVSIGETVPSYVELVPYAVGAGTNDTFDFRVWAWGATTDSTPVYIPRLLLSASVTLGTTGGCDGAAIVTGGLLAQSIVVNIGAGDGVFRSLISTGAEAASSLFLHTRGLRYLEFDFDSTDANITNMNCLFRCIG